MNAAITKGALRTADSTRVSGQRLPGSPPRIIMTRTWLGATTIVDRQAFPREKYPIASEAIAAAGSPTVQKSAVSHASRRPVAKWTPSSRQTPMAIESQTAAVVLSMAAISAPRA